MHVTGGIASGARHAKPTFGRGAKDAFGHVASTGVARAEDEEQWEGFFVAHIVSAEGGWFDEIAATLRGASGASGRLGDLPGAWVSPSRLHSSLRWFAILFRVRRIRFRARLSQRRQVNTLK